MKKTLLIIKTILLVTAIFMMFSCGMDPERSKDECIQEFISNVHAGNWTSMYKQLHPDHSDYNASKSSIYWTPGLFTTATSFTISSRNGDTYTVNVNGSGETYKFEREDDAIFSDGYWSIRSFTNGGTLYD
jgi:hypothetical protein